MLVVEVERQSMICLCKTENSLCSLHGYRLSGWGKRRDYYLHRIEVCGTSNAQKDSCMSYIYWQVLAWVLVVDVILWVVSASQLYNSLYIQSRCLLEPGGVIIIYTCTSTTVYTEGWEELFVTAALPCRTYTVLIMGVPLTNKMFYKDAFLAWRRTYPDSDKGQRPVRIPPLGLL